MNIAYYENGMLVNVFPRDVSLSLYEDRQTAYDADVIVSDGINYDISTVEGVSALPVPSVTPTGNILELSYIFKMRCGVITDQILLPVMVNKALALMRSSGIGWRRRDHLQVIRNYYRLGLFEEGDTFERAYRGQYPEYFSRPEDEAAEGEHESTKAYFRRKWEKKHGLR